MEAYKNTGFLTDYTRLQPAADDKDARVWRAPDAELKKYNKVLLEMITVWIKDNAEYKGNDPTELKALVDYFHDAIAKALGNEYALVNEPGPDVMRLRIAVTELVPTKPEMSVVVLVVPYATIADLASSAASKGGAGRSPYLGDAAIEAMGLDSMTNDLLFEFVERKIGKKYDVDFSKGAGGAVSEGASHYFKSYTAWGYTKQPLITGHRGCAPSLTKFMGRKRLKQNEQW